MSVYAPTAILYLTLGRLKKLAAEHGLDDDAVILSKNGTIVSIESTTNYHPELVITWDDGLPRFWVRTELIP